MDIQKQISLKEHWFLVVRDKQKWPMEEFTYWIIQAGRGFGKTRCASENIVDLILSGQINNIGIIGQHIQQTIDIMLMGESGIIIALEYRYQLKKYFDNEN